MSGIDNRSWLEGRYGVAQPDRFAVVRAYLVAVLGITVWVDEIPGVEQFQNLTPGLLIRGDGGQGLARNVPIGNHRIAMWAHGGTHNGLAAPEGQHQKRLASAVQAEVEGALWTANMEQTAFGVLIGANNVIGAQQIRDTDRDWPVVYSVWEIETKAR